MRGTKYRKVDLHIHTPASKCHNEKKCTARQIVEAAIAQGLEVIAVTDHNTVEWVDKVRQAAKGTPLHVFPGVEITATGGHILAIFDENCPVQRLDDLFPKIDILSENRGKVDAMGADVEKVIKEITALGGIAIGAHANSNNGILKNPQGQHKLKLCRMPELLALEFTREADVRKFTTGAVSPYPAKACVQNSDAHDISAIGRRFTLLKMDLISLNGIRQALLDYEAKVRFEWDDIVARSPRIVSLKTTQGFFDSVVFDFHPGLNCLVGGTGTGKSAAIELLRYAFDDLPRFDSMRQDTLEKALALVGEGGTVSVTCIDDAGHELLIQRTVTPAHDEQPICTDSDGDTAGIQVRPTFFSQGEMAQVARSHLAQMGLIDRYLDLAADNSREQDIVGRLEKNSHNILQCEEKVAQLEAAVTDRDSGKTATTTLIKTLERAVAEPVLKEFPQWEREERFIAERLNALADVPDLVRRSLESIDLDDLFRLKLPSNTPNATILEPLLHLPTDLRERLSKSATQVLGDVQELIEVTKKIEKEWRKAFSKREKTYKSAVSKLKDKTVAAMQKRLRAAKKKLETLEGAENEAQKRREQLRELWSERHSLVTDLSECRKVRHQKRLQLAQSWQTTLNNRIRIDLKHLGDRKEYQAKLKDMLTGSWSQEQDQRLAVEKFEPNALCQAIRANDVETIRAAGIGGEAAKKIVDWLRPKARDLFDLETVPLPDYPDIKFEVEPGRFKSLNTLAAGTKGIVIILLAMVEGDAPLVIDQPEDSLDTLFIYEDIVKKLRQEKDSRQFIFATHNPNLLVSADADLSFVLGATADRGTIESHGGIDRSETNRLLLVHLEGGQEAFRIRAMKYGE